MKATKIIWTLLQVTNDNGRDTIIEETECKDDKSIEDVENELQEEWENGQCFGPRSDCSVQRWEVL